MITRKDFIFKNISYAESLEIVCLRFEGYELTLLTYMTLVRELATFHRW